MLILSMGSLAQGQDKSKSSFTNSYSIAAFGGGWLAQKNTNNNGHYEGLYFNLLFRPNSGASSYGIYGLYSRSGWQDNLSRYSSKTNEYSLGLIYGIYRSRVIGSYGMYSEINFGGDYLIDRGEYKSQRGNYYGEQTSRLLTFGANTNFFKNENVSLATWFTRSQLEFNWHKSVYSQKEATWNKTPIHRLIDSPWDNSFIRVVARQNILSWPGSKNLYFSPKLMLGYEHQYGDGQNSFSLGIGAGLHQRNQDDWLKIGLWLKRSFALNSSLFLLEVSTNFSLM